MSNHQRGYQRDSLILETIEQWKVLDTEQIRLMFFRGSSQSHHLAQRRLLTLCKRLRLKRDRDSMDRPYYYYTQRQGQASHRLGVNWVRLWLMRNLKSWEVLHSFEYEVDYGTLRCDGFAAIKNKVTGKMTFCFIEFDNSLTNPFDKIEKYNKIFERQPSMWWTELTERFPAVIVVTTGRQKSIMAKIQKENTNGLEFRVHDLDEIRVQCDKA